MIRESTGNLIRLAADGEITPEQRAALDAQMAHNPRIGEAIEMERQLRQAIGRSMAASAPSDLRARVMNAMAAESMEESVRGDDAPYSFVRDFGSRRIPPAIAAGFLVLLGGAVIFGILNMPQRHMAPPTGPQIAVGAELSFPVLEHVRCAASPEYAKTKLTLHTKAEVESHFHDELNWSISVPELSDSGFEFVDGGPCTANGRSVESVHLRYSRGEEIVSVWIDRAPRSDLTHLAALEEGHAYEVIPTSRSRELDPANSYLAWREGEFVYRLVPASLPNARQTAIDLGMPDVEFEPIS